MTFVSLEFLIFFIVIITLYFFVEKKVRWVLMLLSSYFFYGYYNPAYVILLLASTTIDFFASLRVYQSRDKRTKKAWLILSITLNLGILFFFKYFNFFLDEFGEIASTLGLKIELTKHGYMLPLGISFYTFQSLAYSIDIYRGYIKPESNFAKFALYLSFFPQLVAGPIERARRLLPQLDFKCGLDYQRVVEGMQLILWGLFKKMVVADRLGLYVNEVFDVSNLHQGPIIIVGGVLFGLQILFDFAGYSEIAIGLARIFGIELSRNFGNCSFFRSPIHMWSNWHITLTNWFRDYLYFPLAKATKGRSSSLAALFATFLFTGLWHGPSWGYVIWGGLHGAFLVFDHITADRRRRIINRKELMKYSSVINVISIIIFLPFNWLTGIFFRADSVTDAIILLNRATDWSLIYIKLESVKIYSQVIIIPLIVFIEWMNIQLKEDQVHIYLNQRSVNFRWGFYLLIIYMILFFHLNKYEASSFVYFQF